MRTRMVTRTVKTNCIVALVVDTKKGELLKLGYDIVGDYNDKELEKIVKKIAEAENNIKFISIECNDIIEGIYGMTEEEFVSLAKPITR